MSTLYHKTTRRLCYDASMYNPHHVKTCEDEKRRTPKKQKPATRHLIDTAMTGVGLIASVSSVPQVIKLYQTADPSGISLTTQLLAFGAVAAWFFYGIYIKNTPLAITSGVTTLVLGTVVSQIIYYS